MSPTETPDLRPDDELEALVRATLRNRAATVSDGPRWTGRRAGAVRHWPAVAASVALVLAVAGGVLWHSRDDGPTPAGSPRSAVQVPLPAAWRAAVHVGPLRPGAAGTVQVAAMTPAGAVLATVARSGHRTDLVLADPDGAVRTLYTVAAPRIVTSVATDGRWAVFGTVADTNQHPAPGVRSQVLGADLHTGTTRLLAAAPAVPRGWVANGGDVGLRDGRAYWAAVPAGQADERTTASTPGRIVAYDLRTRHATVVGHATRLTSNSADPRGVFWPGGGVRADVPAAVAAFSARLNHYRAAAHNGAAWAWDSTPDGRTVGWTDGRSVRRWSTGIARTAHSDLTSVVGVVGPFALIVPMNGTDGRLFVLDTRTGAYADTGIQAFPVAAGGTRVAVLTRANDHAAYRTVVFDVAGLPGLDR